MPFVKLLIKQALTSLKSRSTVKMVYMTEGKVFPGRRPIPKSSQFKRPISSLRNKITQNGEFTPDSNRYILYISYACPWASGANLFRHLLHLENHIDISIVNPKVHDDDGWGWEEKYFAEGSIKDPMNEGNTKHMYEIYQRGAGDDYTGNITVPVLFDKKTGKIVSNESLEIMKMLNNEFKDNLFKNSENSETTDTDNNTNQNQISQSRPDYYPEAKRADIDALNEIIYANINNGVYRVGFANSQEEYNKCVTTLFKTLDEMEERLSKTRYLLGNEITLVDWRLFLTLVRFDPVYYGHFKCNLKRIEEYPNLSNYVRDLYQKKGVSESVNFSHIQEHYYFSHESVNPKRIVALGGVSDLTFPHNRARFDHTVDKNLKLQGIEDMEYKKGPLVKGTFKRGVSGFRTILTPTGTEPNSLPAEQGRYHLYIANNCPWCHRVALGRSLKGLTQVISMDVLYPNRDVERGWQFKPEISGYKGDTANEIPIKFIKELYEREGSKEGSVPILFDKKTGKIVNNESSEILRFFDTAFDDIILKQENNKERINQKVITLVPKQLESDIDAWNAWVYTTINNGAYKAGFASTQEAYEIGFNKFFNALDKINTHLRGRNFLLGDEITEADVRLFPTLFRFDHVYYIRFKLNLKFLREYQYIDEWVKRMWNFKEIQDASNLKDCKQGYFGRTGNNFIPTGPSFPFGE